jgi:predicted ATPase with chaperone activity
VGVRVWGVVEDLLIEVRGGPALPGTGITIEGLPPGRDRTTADRVLAALLNVELLVEAPSLALQVTPPVHAASTSELDLPLALAALARAGGLPAGLRWVFASGRLGLDGRVHAKDGVVIPVEADALGPAELEAEMPVEPPTLVEVVERLCRTPGVEYEHMFEGVGNE